MESDHPVFLEGQTFVWDFVKGIGGIFGDRHNGYATFKSKWLLLKLHKEASLPCLSAQQSEGSTDLEPHNVYFLQL